MTTRSLEPALKHALRTLHTNLKSSPDLNANRLETHGGGTAVSWRRVCWHRWNMKGWYVIVDRLSLTEGNYCFSSQNYTETAISSWLSKPPFSPLTSHWTTFLLVSVSQYKNLGVIIQLFGGMETQKYYGCVWKWDIPWIYRPKMAISRGTWRSTASGDVPLVFQTNPVEEIWETTKRLKHV